MDNLEEDLSKSLNNALELGIRIAKLVGDVHGPARMTEYLLMTEGEIAKQIQDWEQRSSTRSGSPDVVQLPYKAGSGRLLTPRRTKGTTARLTPEPPAV